MDFKIPTKYLKFIKPIKINLENIEITQKNIKSLEIIAQN